MRTTSNEAAATLVLLGLAGGLATAAEPAHEDNNWASMSPASPLTVTAVLCRGETVYVAGSFNAVGHVPASKIAKWDGYDWAPLGEGLPGRPHGGALAMNGNDLYVGLGGQVHKWDGQSWSLVPGTFNHQFYTVQLTSLAFSGTDLYVGGDFSMAGDVPAKGIAKWDGSNWSTLGSGMANGPESARVYALAEIGDDLYAGGIFTSAGGVAANGIARWDGSTWSSLGSGLSGSVDLPPSVTALVASGDDLYVGGTFPMAGGIRVNNIARWNGSSWSALGNGIAKEQFYVNISAMALSGDALFVAGSFDYAGGVPAANFAKWDGTRWSPVASEIGDRMGVSTLAVHGTDLYAGITSWNGDRPEPSIMKWDGAEWTTVGSGTDGSVMALTFVGDQLYVGGSFTFAGGKVSANLARYFPDGVPSMEIIGSRATAFFRGMTAGGYHVDRTTDFITWENLAARNPGHTGGIDFTDESAPETRAFYRVVPVEP